MRAAHLFTCLALAGTVACGRPTAGSAEQVADAFADAYFRRADQQEALRYTAFGASKLLEAELASVKELRASGYTPSEAQIQVRIARGARTPREERVRFDYTLSLGPPGRAATKHADVELAQVHGEWKVVRVTLSK